MGTSWHSILSENYFLSALPPQYMSVKCIWGETLSTSSSTEVSTSLNYLSSIDPTFYLCARIHHFSLFSVPANHSSVYTVEDTHTQKYLFGISSIFPSLLASMHRSRFLGSPYCHRKTGYGLAPYVISGFAGSHDCGCRLAANIIYWNRSYCKE